MKKSIYTFAFAAAAMSQLGSTDCGQVVRDPGFDLWCGDQLCAWKVERGDVKNVPTWNAGDPGVELVGDDVAIEQVSPVTSHDASCLEFDLIANIDETAQVTLNVDVFGDGSVEYTEQIPTARWKSLQFLLPISGAYSGVRFEITKQGSGTAVLAQIAAKTSQSCGDLTPIQPAPAPNGAACDTNAGCRSGVCGAPSLFAGQCVGCNGSTATCGSGDVCGLGDPTSPLYGIPLECIAQHSRELGENCLFDGECASSVCNAGMCSTCHADADCAGAQCAQADWPLALGYAKPWECNPGGHARASGEPCASDDDCASEHCVGTARMQCDDGRACATAADCPFGGPDTTNGLQNGPCDTVGVQGGSCQ